MPRSVSQPSGGGGVAAALSHHPCDRAVGNPCDWQGSRYNGYAGQQSGHREHRSRHHEHLGHGEARGAGAYGDAGRRGDCGRHLNGVGYGEGIDRVASDSKLRGVQASGVDRFRGETSPSTVSAIRGHAGNRSRAAGRDAHRGVAVEPLAHVPSGGPGGDRSMMGGVAMEPRGLGAAPKSRSVKDNFVNRVVEHCGPAVVRVDVEQKVKMPSVEDADLFAFFFGQRPDKLPRERRVKGHGSGFCVDGSAGLVLTNAHVVQGAERITVSFSCLDGPLECEVLEKDEVIDLAALRIKDRLKQRLPDVAVGNSENVKTGDWAIVLGSPLGLRNTCTLGIISSMERSTGETGFDWMRHPLLQTDAAVNQGNSGGPLLNEAGEVIGMVSMRALFGEGIGFATPSETIRAALPDLLQGRKVPRAYLGLKMSESPPSGSESDGRRREGCFVEVVLPRSPAEQAGFAADDEIVEVDGRRIRRFDDVQRLVRSARVNTTFRFRVRRSAGKDKEISVMADDIRNLKKSTEGGSPRGPGRQHGGSGLPRRIVLIPGK